MSNIETMTEEELRAFTPETCNSLEELTALIQTLAEREHDYGTCVYAMSLAAVAAYGYIARKLGATGFQASFADLDIIRRVRYLDGPFMLVKGEDALYPQYDVPGKLTEFLSDIRPWLGEKAREKLANLEADSEATTHPDVVNHWKALAIPNPAETA